MTTTVIYDGECDFCISCVKWVKARTQINALPNQSINPAEYGVTIAQCEKSVVVIADRTYFAAKAVALLLNQSGHKFLALTLRLSGPIGEFGYRYVAAHRNGLLVRILHWITKKSI
ncbi:MAG: thiol-disulfide oxidoreductase DCC family protein [Candidatus Nanopelagicaceae bacterium]